MGTTQAFTYCRICEPLCGLEATVRDGGLLQIRPDRRHPLSKGFACPKGIAMTEVQNDPDRVVHPLRRRADGSGFDRVSWDEALDDIAGRLNAIRRRHGGEAIGWYFGNPATFSYSHPLWMNGFMAALGSPHFYSAGSQDTNNRFAASALLYGSPVLVPIPDLKRTDLLLMLGANPHVSHGSLITAPRVKDDLAAIVRRGGRVIVGDPRRTETARAYEHLPVLPDGDAWLLLSLLNVLFDEELEDRDACARQATGVRTLRRLAAAFPPEETASRSGVPAPTARALARDLAAAERAVVYGRTGTCLGRYGTLTAFLIDAVTLVTGNLDRPGGGIFGGSPIRVDEILRLSGLATYGRTRSRVGGYPDVLGTFPAGVMAEEITTPGPGRLRALLVSAGNPVSSLPGSAAVDAALDELDLLVCIDLYVTDTGRKADYVLPATTFLEREDFPLPFLQNHLTRTSRGPSPSSRRAARPARNGRSSTTSRGGCGSASARSVRNGSRTASASARRRAAWSTRCCAPDRTATGTGCGAAASACANSANARTASSSPTTTAPGRCGAGSCTRTGACTSPRRRSSPRSNGSPPRPPRRPSSRCA
ncbi:molybdopterin-dependent oxidoreductase [Actinomadura sp. J1-007]|uniref:molybdopterin-dependent oxidoreductase n=1 Tax=Actinomadura sp. J1-007 TaxID=2661913 RepID=UPI001F4FFF25|nr:molybdopterin-dependent oxidoreductase [Actinomadura sp. J1-007]